MNNKDSLNLKVYQILLPHSKLHTPANPSILEEEYYKFKAYSSPHAIKTSQSMILAQEAIFLK